MLNRVRIFFIIVSVLVGSLFGQQKLAQTGFQFLSVNPDARASALAGAMTTVANFSGALWANPAMLSESGKSIEVSLYMNRWIAGIVHNGLSASFRPSQGEYGVLGISLQYVDYGDVEGTQVAYNKQGYIETGIIKPFAFLFSLGYARELTNKFSVGGQVKWAQQYLGPAITSYVKESNQFEIKNMKASGLAFDIGTHYKTGWKSIVFGMSVRNFSEEIKYAEEGFQLPLTFNIGVSANVMDFVPKKYKTDYLLVTMDAVHPRSHPEYIKIGLEYRLLSLLDLRMGYMSNTDEKNFTFGFGVHKFGLHFDYAYIPFGVFNNVQRFALRFAM